MPILAARNVWKTYANGTDTAFHALQDVSLQIEEGEFAALMGPSGSGKSTLLHLLGGLDTPSRGEVLYADRALAGRTEAEIARLRGEYVGFVFQSFNLVPRLTTLENVLLPMRFSKKRGRSERAARATELLGRVGLGDRLNHPPNKLSGGERQRVAIARALVNDPQILLADEPTGNLDSKTGEEILQVLAELNDEGRTLIIVTHDSDVAARCRRVLEMRDGRILRDGPPGGA